MAKTPPNDGLGRLLTNLNSGWQVLRGLGGPAGAKASGQSDEAGESLANSNLNCTNDEFVENDGSKCSTPRAAGTTTATIVTMEGNKKRAATPRTAAEKKKKKTDAATNDTDLGNDSSRKKTPKKKKQEAAGGTEGNQPAGKTKKKKTDAATAQVVDANATDPGHDPPRKKVANPMDMISAIENGHDSDGWDGPPTGTDPAELDAAAEETIAENDDDKKMPAVPTEPFTPEHVPIDEDTFKKLTNPQLKHELEIRRAGLPKKRNKPELQKRLREALNMELVVHETYVPAEKKKKDDDMSHFAVGAKWTPLDPDIDVPEPINDGFPFARAPTVPKEDAKVPPRPKKSFSKTFKRPEFEGDKKRGGPKQEFLTAHGLDKDSLPVEFAEAFLPMYENPIKDRNGDAMFSMEYIARNTNTKANLCFAGEAKYQGWKDFSIKEIRQHLGLYVLNGLSPSPGMERKFNPMDKANYNHFCATEMGTNATRRLAEFRAFMTCQDPLKATPDRKVSPLFKTLSIVKWIQRVGPMSWECGIDLGLDEQTLGFKGNHVDKLRITYKAEGDGFQCDALCDEGFTFSVYFRNEVPPSELVRLGLSPLHARSIWLFDQLEKQHHRVWVDNLYMSAKLAKASFLSKNKVLVSGVTRTKDRGTPNSVLQTPCEKASDITTIRGNVKAAVLIGDDDCPDLVALSLYDNKPVHFITMACESIKWVNKTRKVWNHEERSMVDIDFLRINVNDDYNLKMNAVDVADQLRNHYRMSYWLRQRKWWWAIFIWGLGVLLTNSYKVYVRVQEEAGVPKENRLTHYDFLHSIAVAWISRTEVTPREIKRQRQRMERQAARAANDSTERQPARAANDSTPQRRGRSPVRKETPTTPLARNRGTPQRESSTPRMSPNRAPRVNEKTLDPDNGSLRCRLDHFGNFHCPIPPESKAPSCAMHRFFLGRKEGSNSQTRDTVVCCRCCKVHLCLPCFSTFHEVRDIVGQKEDLAQHLE